jgi:hypothetical protein
MSAQRTLDEWGEETEDTSAGSDSTPVLDRTDRDACAAHATSTDERCQKPAVPGMDVCQDHLHIPEELADTVTDLLADPLRCTTCATRVRDTYPEYDTAEAIRLSVGPTTQAFDALGTAEIAADGTVDVTDPRLRLTSNATHEETADGPVVFCCECGREPDDRVAGSRPQDRLVDVACRIAARLDLDVADATLAEAVDAANDADTDDPTVISEALLRSV